MKLKELISRARTCRRFKGDHRLSSETLADLVDHARLSASARNHQVLRFITIADRDTCEAMNALVVMGGSLTPEQRATATQHPGGFIVIAGPEKMDDFALMDVGIAAQSINLAACEAGLACCMIGAVKRNEAAALLELPKELQVKLVLALGEPDEVRHLVERRSDGSLTYYRDENDEHCVPKISLEEAIIIRK
ncbi:nitroreductase family protein [uncultured Mailhella sp.]|uniref:nitroreductase family protein n=1 Tax=uncultured Mailhella sp. TaxID=1981031 RepID=UPI0025D36DA2|nr:nitroreductase family protein [uncultured Mailhella sp.]